VNQNQGAESTLAFLLSLAEMQLAQNTQTSFHEPPLMVIQDPIPVSVHNGVRS
jgi:hypothetical protein